MPPPGPDQPEGNAERFREADERMRLYWAGDRAMLSAWAGRVCPRVQPAWLVRSYHPYGGAPYRASRPYRNG